MAERKARINLYVGPQERIKREELDRYEKSGEWVAEEKKDGVWCLATIEGGIITALTSRTGLPLAASMVGLKIGNDDGVGQLAGELVADTIEENGKEVRGGERRLHLFEPLFWNSLDLRALPLEERREALEMIFDTFTDDYASQGLGENYLLFLVERRTFGFLKWYDEIMGGKLMGSGAEGLVLKRKGSEGIAVNADGKVPWWVRCKPLNTVDYVVIGPDGTATKGTPKIALGLYKKTKDGVRIVKVMSPTWPNKMDLRPGMVVEVEGAEVFPSGAVRHGHIKRIRTDKAAVDCTYEAAIAS